MHTSQKGISVKKQKGHKKIRTKKMFCLPLLVCTQIYRNTFFFKKKSKVSLRQTETNRRRSCPSRNGATAKKMSRRPQIYLPPFFGRKKIISTYMSTKDTFTINFSWYIKIFNAAIFVDFPRFQVRKGKGGGEKIYEDKLIHDFLLLLFLQQLPPQSLQKKIPLQFAIFFVFSGWKMGFPLRGVCNRMGKTFKGDSLAQKVYHLIIQMNFLARLRET